MDNKALLESIQTDIKESLRNPKYRKLVEVARKTRKKYFGLGFSDFEIPALISYVKRWEGYRKYLQESGVTTRDDVAPFITANLGVVAMQYAALPIPLIASVQPLSDQIGRVYYRKFIATHTRGGITEGDALLGDLGAGIDKMTDLPSYYGEAQSFTSSITVGTSGSDITVTHTDIGTLLSPVRPRSVKIRVFTPGRASLITEILDNGEGKLIGDGVRNGTIDYSSGTFSFTVVGEYITSTGDYVFDVEYHQDILSGDDLPGFKYEMGAKEIRVEYWTINTITTYFTSYDVRNRFGISLEEQILRDLILQMNSTIMSVFMFRLIKAALRSSGATSYTDLPLYDESSVTRDVVEYRRAGFMSGAVVEAVQSIARKTGKRFPTFLIVSDSGSKIVTSLGINIPPNNPTTGQGAFYMGVLSFLGKPVHVFYVDPNIVKAAADKYFPSGITLDQAKNLVVVGVRDEFWFDAPMVYAPYLPITLGTGSVGRNVFTQAHTIVHAAGIDSLVPELTTVVRVENLIA